MKRIITTAPRQFMAWSVLMLGFCLSAAGQGRFGGFGRRGGTPPQDNPKDAATTALIAQMYANARSDVDAVPSLMAPTLLLSLAQDEARWMPNRALADVTSAFKRALALPTGSREGAAPAEIKAEVEMMAVTALARGGHFDEALGLARRADVAKGPLYDALIENLPQAGSPDANGRPEFLFGFGGPFGGRFRDRGRRGKSTESDNASRTNEIFTLVEECQNADGTFPYRGVAGVLRWPGLDALSRILLLQQGYRAAGNATDPDQIAEALFLLRVGHQVMPEMDAQLSSALSAMVRRLQSATGDAASGMASRDASRALGLLREVDPAAATALVQNSPTESTTVAAGDFGGAGGFAGGRRGGATAFGSGAAGGHPSLYVQFSTTVTAPASNDDGEAVGAERFRSLVTQAEGEWRTDPDGALTAANSAAGLLDAAIWSTEMEVAARLATVYAELGDGDDAARIMTDCLNHADRQGVAFDASYHNADAATQAAMVLDGGAAESAILATYSLAARWDLETTAERAEESPMVLLKPLIQSRVALVAEAGERGLYGFRRGFGGRFGPGPG